MQNHYFYIIVVVVLSIFLVYQEVKRSNRKRLGLRIGASLIAVASLLFLIVPIKYHEKRTIDAKVINFLTPGSESLSRGEGTYFTSDSAVLNAGKKAQVTYIPDLLYYLSTHPEITGVNVFGYGLSEAELHRLKNIQLRFNSPELPSGILACSWPSLLPASERLQVQGIYNNNSDKAVKLSLLGVGSQQDSISIPAKTKRQFTLSAQPAQQGRAIYQLRATLAGKVVNSEKIPFQVNELPKPRILVLAAFPDFEYKFLRNWLFEHQYPAFIRVRISKDKFSTEQLNFDRPESSGITAEQFKKFDLVIADDDELASLGSLGLALHRSIDAGTGLILRLNESEAASNFGRAFSVTTRVDSITKSVRPVLNRANRPLAELPVIQPLYLASQETKLALLKDLKGRWLAATALKGRGRITATTLPATFRWVMNGSKGDYGAYWSELITQTSRKSDQGFFWNVVPEFPRVTEQLKINFQHEINTGLAPLKVNDERVAVQQHLVLPFFWQASYRAENVGWNELEIDNAATQRFYVYGKNEWKAEKFNKLVQQNTAFSKKQHLDAEKFPKEGQIVDKSISRWVFVAFFLLSAGFLWFETKILQ